MRIVLISTYEMGRQPFGLASPAAWLRRAGFEVHCADLSRGRLDPEALAGAGLVALFLPMHTATRLALRLLPQLRAAAAQAHFCGYGLYAAINREHLLAAGMDSVLGGEFEGELTALAERLAAGEPPAPSVPPSPDTLPRLAFLPPDRAGLPPLERYAHLEWPDGTARVTGYTEASRGCKHHCRHCPIVPVYGGRFRVVAPEVVLADIRQQVAAGAEHVTFGDPDFFNGPTHALRIAAALHREFPALSYDVTIKVEHLLRHADRLATLRDTGCALVTTAVESFDDAVLARLEKGHTAADFFRVLALTRAAGLALNPTFVSFTPWTTPASFATMVRLLDDHGLVPEVSPVQYGIRLLIPAGSGLLELPDAPQWLGAFDPEALSYRWRHPDPAVDVLCGQVQAAVAQGSREHHDRGAIFEAVCALAAHGGARVPPAARPRATVPYLNEPWFC